MLAVIALLIAVAVRWARHAGEFEAKDIARGMGALLFVGFAAVAVLQFARRLTGAEFGYLEQRFLLAQVTRWEWAVMLISLGVMLIAAAELSRTRRWVVLLPITAGLACSIFHWYDLIGAVSGVAASAIGYFTYGKPVNRKGAWAGILILGWVLAVVVQIAAPAAPNVAPRKNPARRPYRRMKNAAGSVDAVSARNCNASGNVASDLSSASARPTSAVTVNTSDTAVMNSA